ncbi:MarC family protein [Marinibactrum halimedae]|nr:MarC family protein [Marinibactrum halimedae]MCD9461013.1 NAAT family transporter [Marinibactrum halimedae]
MEPISAFFTLIFVMDPLGNIPVFLSLLKNVDNRRRIKVILRELLIALVVMFVFLFFGSYFLEALQLEQPAVKMAGAIVLLIIALRMIFPQAGGIMGEDQYGGEPFIVPLAIPLIAGPSTLATLMLMAHTEGTSLWLWTLVVIGAWAVTSAVLLASPLLYKLLKERGLLATERLMGMILIMIAVQMFFSGLAVFLNIEGH